MATNNMQEFGIHNRWAPILFSVFYLFTFMYYLFRSIRNHGSANVYRGLALFSLIRITAFALRASIAFSSHASSSRDIGIAYSILYNVGFFSLLLSAYNLIHNRERLAKLNERASKVTSLFHKGRIVHILLGIAVILGVVGAVLALRGPSTGTGTGLFRAMEYIFLGVAVIIAILTVMAIMLENRVSRAGTASAPIGAKHHWLIMLTIAALLLARMLYFASTAHSRKLNKQRNEHLWWPLAALTEFLVVLLMLTPGLVPLAAHYIAHERREKGVPVGERDAYAGNNNNVTGAGYNNGVGHDNGVVGAGHNGAGVHAGHNAGFRGSDNVV